MKSFGGITIFGYLLLPKNKPFPKVLIHFGGYSGAPYPQKKFYIDDMAVFIVAIRGHGLSSKDLNPGFQEHQFLLVDLLK